MLTDYILLYSTGNENINIPNIHELASTRDQLNVRTEELASTRAQLEGSYREIESARDQLGVRTEELASTRAQLEGSYREIESARAQLNVRTEELASTRAQLEACHTTAFQSVIEGTSSAHFSATLSPVNPFGSPTNFSVNSYSPEGGLTTAEGSSASPSAESNLLVRGLCNLCI